MEFFNNLSDYCFMCQSDHCMNVGFRILPEGYIMCESCGQEYQYNATTTSWVMVTDDFEEIDEKND
jgi:transcription initiation factor IIE alpha subunit